MIVIGDSHIHSLVLVPGIKLFHIQPLRRGCTAFHLEDKVEEIESIITTYLSPGELLLFTFGEIDARIHIYYQSIRRHESIASLCTATAEQYLRFVSSLQIPNTGIILPPPQGFEENLYEYPAYASREVRQGISNELCKEMVRYCATYNLKYIDLYPQWRNILPDSSFFFDEVHVCPEIASPLLEQAIKKLEE